MPPNPINNRKEYMKLLKDRYNCLNEHEKQVASVITNAKAGEVIDITYLEQFFENVKPTLENLIRLKIIDYVDGQYEPYSL